MNKTELVLSLYQRNMIKFGDFTLKSGQKTPVYINLREVIAYPKLLQVVADAEWSNLPTDAKVDLICGVPYSALTLATHLSIKHDLPMVLRRKEVKAYGTKQKLEGVFHPGQHCVIIEDVVTSGQSILETARELHDAGLNVKHVLTCVDREQGGRENLKAAGITMHSVINLSEILSILCQAEKLNESEKNRILSLLKKETPCL